MKELLFHGCSVSYPFVLTRPVLYRGLAHFTSTILLIFFQRLSIILRSHQYDTLFVC